MIPYFKQLLKERWERHTRDNKELKEMILAVMFLLLIVIFVSGFFIGKYTAQDCTTTEDRIERVEEYMALMESGIKIKPITGVIHNTTTIEESINTYRKYGIAARFVLGSVLEDVCD